MIISSNLIDHVTRRFVKFNTLYKPGTLALFSSFVTHSAILSKSYSTEDTPCRRARPAPPICSQCGRRGYTSNVYPRDDYSADVASLGYTTCVQDVTSARNDDTIYKVYVGIIPCPQHDTMVANPPVVGNRTPL